MQHGAHGEGTGGGGQRTGISEGTGSRGQRTGICEGAGGGGQAEEGTGGSGGQRTGICKWFNVVRGYGFIQPHDGSHDVFVHQSVIKMAGFRSLAEGEEVEFDSQPSDKGVEATFVCGVQGSDCRGSDRRPISKKKFRKIRCFNCGEYANHIAAKCPHPPLPKRCHNCKSSDHLIADCPQRKQENSETENGGQAETGGEHSSNGGDSPTPPALETSSGTMSGLAS